MLSSPYTVKLIIIAAKIIVVFSAVQLAVMAMIYFERRVSAWIQDRLGPNRVGPQGVLQPVADGIKFLFKEDVIPNHVDKFLYVLAPILILIPAMVSFAVIPFGDKIEFFGKEIELQIANVNIGILFVLAMGSVGIYGVVFGAWASNNKYSLLGGLRASAQMISYEVALGLSIVGVLMMAGTLQLDKIVAEQDSFFKWYIFRQPLAFLIFLIAAFAETNRLPFDLPEAEQELVAGYHTEYSSMKFAMFFMAEYASMITFSALITTLFFGGWQCPLVESLDLPASVLSLAHVASFVAKTAFFLFFYLWIRWTLPRFRYDQLMKLGWKVLLPASLLNIFGTGILMAA